VRISEHGPQPLCRGETELFFGPEEDGREEEGRADREDLCKQICWQCPLRMPCLRWALVQKEQYGVWGGQGEGERKAFRMHLVSEGYRPNEVPEELELFASEKQFRRDNARKARERYLSKATG
jgi:hypothetical protein